MTTTTIIAQRHKCEQSTMTTTTIIAINFIAFSLLISSAYACGLTTHSLVAHRTATVYFNSSTKPYNDIINKYMTTMLAGAPSPDYLFQCGGVHSNGEYDHWDDYQINATNYIRSLPPGDDRDQLIAFFFGVVSHYIADINWHGLSWGGGHTPNNYGLIETLGFLDYGCDGGLCEVAHLAADTGGEFVAAYQTDLSWWHPIEGHLPTQHIVNIFALANRHVTAFSLDECHLEFGAAGVAIKDLGALAFRNQTFHSPSFVEFYASLPVGGIEDMAAWSSRMWLRFIDWLENGPPPPSSSSSSSSKKKNTKTAAHRKTYEQYLRFLRDLGRVYRHYDGDNRQEYLSALLVTQTQAPVTMAEQRVVKWWQTYVGTVVVSSPPSPPSLSPSPPQSQSSKTTTVNDWSLVGDRPLLYTGSSLCVGDFDGDGGMDVVVGMPGDSTPGNPQYGSVLVRYNNTQQVVLSNSNEVFGRFGASIVTMDWNLDGIDDLVVGAPFAGWDWSHVSVEPTVYRYFGRVFVYFGRKGLGLSTTTPNVVIRSATQVLLFGTQLSVGDVNGDGHDDLLVGCPYSRGNTTDGIHRGSVYAFVASATSKSSLTPDDADIVLHASSNFQWFGHALKVIDNDPTHGRVLVIGAPAYHTSSSVAVGAVYGFALPSLKNIFMITGVSQSGKFGASLEYGRFTSTNAPELVVGTPTYSPSTSTSAYWAGEVSVFSLQNVAGTMSIDQVKRTSVLQANTYGARFGWCVHVITNNDTDDLLVGAPLTTDPYSQDHETGRVSLYRGGVNFPTGVHSDPYNIASWSNTGHDKHGRFGHAIVTLDATTIIVAEPHYSINVTHEMVGAVHAYSL